MQNEQEVTVEVIDRDVETKEDSRIKRIEARSTLLLFGEEVVVPSTKEDLLDHVGRGEVRLSF